MVCKIGEVSRVLEDLEQEDCDRDSDYVIRVGSTNWFFLPVCGSHLEEMEDLLEEEYGTVKHEELSNFGRNIDFGRSITKLVVDNISMGDEWSFDPTWEGFPEAHAAITYYDYWPEEYETSHIIDVYEEKAVLCNDLKTIKVWRSSSIEENVKKAMEYMSEERVEE